MATLAQQAVSDKTERESPGEQPSWRWRERERAEVSGEITFGVRRSFYFHDQPH